MYKVTSLWQADFRSLIFLGSFVLYCNGIGAQDIEPRRWNNLPLGTNIAGMGYAYSYGDVLFDPLLDVEDVEVDVHTIILTYVQPFKLGKKLGRLDVLLPVSFAVWEGLLSGDPARAERNGLADPRIRFSYHLIGPPAMGPQELKEYLAENYKYTILGVSFAISLPLGQYNDERLLNLGLNQFVFRPQIGMMHNWGLWSYELSTSVSFFTRNNDFFNSSAKRQDPLFAAQTHLIKRFATRNWASVSIAYGLGAKSVVNRQPNDDLRANLLGAVSFGFPIGKKQNAKLVYIRSETQKDIGADTNSLILAWSIAF